MRCDGENSGGETERGQAQGEVLQVQVAAGAEQGRQEPQEQLDHNPVSSTAFREGVEKPFILPGL